MQQPSGPAALLIGAACLLVGADSGWAPTNWADPDFQCFDKDWLEGLDAATKSKLGVFAASVWLAGVVGGRLISSPPGNGAAARWGWSSGGRSVRSSGPVRGVGRWDLTGGRVWVVGLGTKRTDGRPTGWLHRHRGLTDDRSKP